MQGNKKHTEGHSDSSSIGSLLDDTDREVSSLTDRAFKSLCVAELEDSYNEPDLAISPDFTLQFSAKFHPGTLSYAIKKSNICNKLTARNNEHTISASTFQQLPKCAPEENRIAKNNTFSMEKKNLNLPVPSPRNNKHVSKVSSLIKTFDKTADQGSVIAIKQPSNNSFQKCKLNHGSYKACLDDTVILSNHKELSEFSEASQDSHCLSGKHEPQKRPNNIDLSYCDSDSHYPVLIEMSKVAKSNFSRSSKKALKTRSVKVNEPAKKGNFLHSENSAFESWNVHHKKLTEKGEFNIKVKKEDLTYLEEAPFIKGSQTHDHKLPSVKTTIAKKQKKDFQMKPNPPEAAFSIPLTAVYVPQEPLASETEFSAALPPTPPPRTRVHQGPPQPPPVPYALSLPPPTHQSHSPTPPTPEAPPVPPLPMPVQLSPPALSQESMSPQSMSHRIVSPSPMSQAPSPPAQRNLATLVKEEALSPQMGNTCPPWRRQRATKRGAERGQTSKETITASDETWTLSEKVTGAESGLDVTPLAKQVNSPGSVSPSFNISELLTPIIPPKQEMDTVESELIPLTPPPAESMALRDHNGSTFSDYGSRDSYKSKASSLLFNLKDVRKRVKSMYTPSPLLRALEEKNRTRKSVKKSTEMNASFLTLQEISNKNIVEKDELSDIASMLSGSVPEKDNKTDLTGHFTDNYLTLSSPQTTEDLLFYQTGDNLQQDNSTHQDLVKNTGDNENLPLFRHESNEPDLRKHQQYPSLKPFNRDNTDTTAGQPVQSPNVQDEENERQAAIQNDIFAFKTLPSQLSPEEDVPYSDTQTVMAVPGCETQGKRSASSSEQSFVSTVEQPVQEELSPPVPLMQKACLQENQRTKSEMSTDNKENHKERGKEVEEDEPQYYACISSGTSTAEKRGEKVAGNEQRNLLTEKVREKREEVKSMDSASDTVRDMSIPRSEEPQPPPPSSSSIKPSLFMIKDNTFRSPQVIRAVKLPLFRSFSLDDTVSSSYKEMESRFMPPAEHNKQHRYMLRAQEVGWLASRYRGQQDVKDGAADREKEASEPGSTSATLDPSILEDTESFSSGKLMEVDEEACALLNKVGKMNEEIACRRKEKPQTRKARHSLTQPNLGLENDQSQNNPIYPTERKTNYFNNHHLSNRRGGSCAKKIITRETISPETASMSENHMCSPVSHEGLEDILHAEGEPVLLDSLACTGPRSGSKIHSLTASLSSDKPIISGLSETEDATNPALLNVSLKKQAGMSAEEILDSTRRNMLSESAGEAERLEPRGLGERAAGKPPAVPPKTEKALRRAKKLASRRKKMQEQQKNHQAEHTDAVDRKSSHSGQTLASHSPLGYSPLHPAPHSTFTATEISAGRPSGVSAVSPSPSSTQRKLLQDPDSGQYYVVDLPAEVNLKTFYDPETGKYVQVSVPSSGGNIYQPPSSEIVNSPYASYPRVMPLPASSVAVLKSPSQPSEPTWLVPAVPGELADLPEGGHQDYRYTEAVDTQPYIEPSSYSCRQDTEETQVHLGKGMSPIPNTGIVSLTDLDDFVAEGVS
ncbi:cardiac-enriched FHL2-interacting protein [Dryobates pubescens]|uniref:cardiac-enriched FHL2-interacting protein n=1 Tax=Dryobates pubescens TaxID=118200 RepID=UPI0023B9E710|nr:cardiac-enriched FHL2-interacting protein [Dryobates pubescens]